MDNKRKHSQRPKDVYVGQEGAFCRVPLDIWVEICRAAAEGKGYDLSGFRQIKKPPRGIRRSHYKSGYAAKYYSTRSDVYYLEPLNWYPDDFSLWLKLHFEEAEAPPVHQFRQRQAAVMSDDALLAMGSRDADSGGGYKAGG